MAYSLSYFYKKKKKINNKTLAMTCVYVHHFLSQVMSIGTSFSVGDYCTAGIMTE